MAEFAEHQYAIRYLRPDAPYDEWLCYLPPNHRLGVTNRVPGQPHDSSAYTDPPAHVLCPSPEAARQKAEEFAQDVHSISFLEMLGDGHITDGVERLRNPDIVRVTTTTTVTLEAVDA